MRPLEWMLIAMASRGPLVDALGRRRDA